MKTGSLMPEWCKGSWLPCMVGAKELPPRPHKFPPTNVGASPLPGEGKQEKVKATHAWHSRRTGRVARTHVGRKLSH